MLMSHFHCLTMMYTAVLEFNLTLSYSVFFFIVLLILKCNSQIFREFCDIFHI